jgi:hypothetical protein
MGSLDNMFNLFLTRSTEGPASDGEEGQHVSLANRALPLIELLTAAAASTKM